MSDQQDGQELSHDKEEIYKSGEQGTPLVWKMKSRGCSFILLILVCCVDAEETDTEMEESPEPEEMKDDEQILGGGSHLASKKTHEVDIQSEAKIPKLVTGENRCWE